MAQTGFSTIQIYGSPTAGNVPTSGNLTNSTLGAEIALNYADGKLYYKDTGGTVQLLATKGGVGSSTTTQVLYNSSGLVVGSANMTFNGTTLTLANDASISGLTVGKGGASNTYNSAFGYSVLASNTSGGSNSGFGYNSLTANTSGGNNTAFGTAALFSNTTGSSNTALGVSALQSGTAASQNTAVGYQSLYANNGVGNTATGQQSLYSNTSGTYNVSVGNGAGYYITTGSWNSSLGTNTLSSNNSGATGSYNTAFGGAALASNTTASNNTAVGYQAGYSNTTGANNVFIGRLSGYSNTANGGNTFVGDESGYSNTTGSGNTFIGSGSYGAGYYVTTGSNNTIIGGYGGNNGGLDIRTASNYIVLSDGAGNPRQIINGSGSVLIGRTSNVRGAMLEITAQGSGNAGGISIDIPTAGNACYECRFTGSSGTIYYGYWSYNGSVVGSITSTGTATLYNTTSDQRLKENIVNAGSGLEKLANVKIRAFNWKESKNHTDFGVVAQELYEVAPECVTVGTDKEDGSIDKPWAVDTSALVPAMIKAIQELNAKVTALEAQLGA